MKKKIFPPIFTRSENLKENVRRTTIIDSKNINFEKILKENIK